MASVTHYYPWLYYDEDNDYKYGYQWSTGTVTLSGNYTHYQIFNNALPSCSEIKLDIEAASAYTGIFNRTWYVWVYANGWYQIGSFTMPAYEETGDTSEPYSASYSGTFPLSTIRNVKYVTAGPSSRMSSSNSWSMRLSVDGAKITEAITEATLSDSEYFCGLCTKRSSSLYTDPAKVQVNIGGNLVTATDISVNIGGSLVSLPKMKQYVFLPSAKEEAVIISFTPNRSGTYKFKASDKYAGSTNDGYGYYKVHDSNMNELMTYYTTGTTTLSLTAGTEYKIILIDYPTYTTRAQRIMKVYST